MELIPAIDIKGGQVVRLVQGDFSQATVYDSDPVAVARRWEQQGASRLHVVDLDGARVGRPVNTDAVLAIVRAIKIPVQLGGGLRSEDAVAAALALGVAQVVLGTVAVREPEIVARLTTRYQGAIIVGVDARDGMVATQGWTETTRVPARDLVARMRSLGVTRVIYTDISRDGTLTAPNYEALAGLIGTDSPEIIASGGVSAVTHVLRLAELGVSGAIVGTALYTGRLHLSEAMRLLHNARHRSR